MVHHVYRDEDGCLVRFSLLPGGAVKKAQWLGGKLRMMSFEWTHLSSPREVYERMVEGATLKVPHPDNADDLRKRTFEKYQQSGIAGWLHPGTPLKAAVEWLGKPAESKEGQVVWKFTSDDAHWNLGAVFDDDEKLLKLTHEGVRFERYVKGNLDWLEEALDHVNGAGENPFREERQDASPPGLALLLTSQDCL